MLRVLIANRSTRHSYEHASGPLILGRQPSERPGITRRVIDDTNVSRDQLEVEEVSGGKLRLRNLSTQVKIEVSGGMILGAGQSHLADLPVRLTVGLTLIEFEHVQSSGQEAVLRSVGSATVALESGAHDLPKLSTLGEAPGPIELTQWFERLVAVQLAAAGASDVYQSASHAMVDLIGLDYGLVLIRTTDGRWEVNARHGEVPTTGDRFSTSLLERVASDRQTFYEVIPESAATHSRIARSLVVASPILSSDGQTALGAVYGVRLPTSGQGEPSIRPIEAQVVQVLAASVTAGLARLGREQEVVQHRQRFRDFFSAELAEAIEHRPKLLDGERRTITILFSDIRGFSRISERLSPEDTCALVRDVMERLTVRIREHQGVVVDYLGDALLALWNAPADQPDHATLACRAALAMLEELPGLNARWADRVGGPFGFGIGLNTGEALVGNTGSQSRFKYGPLGHAVNLASRVEGATKHLGVPILITGNTHAALAPGEFLTRRLCQIKVVGIEGPVHLHELHPGPATPEWLGFRKMFESGLQQFESGEVTAACATLAPLLQQTRANYDRPSLQIVSAAFEAIKHPEKPFEPILKLDGK